MPMAAVGDWMDGPGGPIVRGAKPRGLRFFERALRGPRHRHSRDCLPFFGAVEADGVSCAPLLLLSTSKDNRRRGSVANKEYWRALLLWRLRLLLLRRRAHVRTWTTTLTVNVASVRTRGRPRADRPLSAALAAPDMRAHGLVVTKR